MKKEEIPAGNEVEEKEKVPGDEVGKKENVPGDENEKAPLFWAFPGFFFTSVGS